VHLNPLHSLATPMLYSQQVVQLLQDFMVLPQTFQLSDLLFRSLATAGLCMVIVIVVYVDWCL